MRMMLAAASLMALAGCQTAPSARVASAPTQPATFAKAAFQPWGVDLTAGDRTVKPGDDFWSFVNGAWAARTAIAEDRTFVGVDSVLNDKIETDVRAIIEDSARAPGPQGSVSQQVGDLYASFMDEAGIEARGTAPLKPYLDRIAAATTPSDIAALFGTPGYAAPISTFLNIDRGDPTRYVAYVSQGGLGLPGRDYYLLDEGKFPAYRAAYLGYLEKVARLAGLSDPAGVAARTLAFETALARVHWTPIQSRDAKATNNPMTAAELAAYAPGLDWSAMLRAGGLDGRDTYVVRQKSAIRDEAAIIGRTDVATLKDWMAVRFVSSMAPYLPKAFADANFDFYSKTLRDVPVQRARWKRGVELVSDSIGEGVGQIYVQRHYPAESDRQMGELIANMRSALQEKIDRNSWMDGSTRAEAQAKLASFDPRTGHPAKYIDYSTLSIARDDLIGNIMRGGEFEWKLMLDRGTRPVDRSLWNMTPQTNNAYYSPVTNQITFPAAILQPPYFDPNADPAANYGSIGATIGHEIGHGFDDQGRLYDSTGKLRDWWTPASAAAYKVQSDKLIAQYDSYEPIPGTHIKGALTLGENIGDLAGLEVAYAAWRKYVATHGEPAVIGGLTGDQRFFIAYGYSWQFKAREGAQRAQLLTDPHSPAKYRVNGVVRNFDPWYQAFNVQPGDKLYLPPEQRVKMW